ncbi:MAG: hypothetical protein ED557_10300 [Balneola sp.]|nr:MAG: hypothetical protein ED557_10300 [Balneola sp.]
MRASVLILISCFCIASSVSARQTIPRIANNEYKFAKGKVLVSLADTVSPDFVSYHFSRMGYEIVESDINPVRGYFNKNVTKQELENFSSHPYINKIVVDSRSFNEQAFLEMVKRQNMSAEDSLRNRRFFERFSKIKTHWVTFNYFVTEEMAFSFLETIPELEMRLGMTSPRSVIVKTEVGKEEKAMRSLKLINYVENTAFIMLQGE